MNVVLRVRAEAERGGTIGSIAARLGLASDLVAAIVAELAAQGLLREACAPGGCPPAPACSGCPLAPRSTR